jgi:hypothetical protein
MMSLFYLRRLDAQPIDLRAHGMDQPHLWRDHRHIWDVRLINLAKMNGAV